MTLDLFPQNLLRHFLYCCLDSSTATSTHLQPLSLKGVKKGEEDWLFLL